jgi:hypothetical protein
MLGAFGAIAAFKAALIAACHFRQSTTAAYEMLESMLRNL